FRGKERRMANKPVIDLRIYTIRPRGMPQYLKLFEELALPLALKYLGEPLGYYVTQIGTSEPSRSSMGVREPGRYGTAPRHPRRRSGFRQIPHCDGRFGRRSGGPDNAGGRVQRPVLGRRSALLAGWR